MTSYDALLLVSFGGPNGPDEVLPFLQNITEGKNIPPQRLESVAKHYEHFGGVSPIVAENAAILSATRAELDRRGNTTPIYFGCLHAPPFLDDVIATIGENKKVQLFCLSAYSSYASCGKYVESIRAAKAKVAPTLIIDKVPPYSYRDGFLDPLVRSTAKALAAFDSSQQQKAELLFTAHSLPIAQTKKSPYVPEVKLAASEIVDRLEEQVGRSFKWKLAWQSRSGSPKVPWLEPSIKETLAQHAWEESPAPLVIVPVGFVCENMETAWDLDVEARQQCEELGIPMQRARTGALDAQFASMIADILVEEEIGSDTCSNCELRCK